MPLTVKEIDSLSCPEGQSQVKRSDGNGLFLFIKKNGSKLWRFRFRYSSKYQEMALGKYPSVPLKEARKLAAEARASLVNGINPMDERRERKRSKSVDQNKLFSAVAIKWWEQKKDSWSEDHAARVRRWIIIDSKSICKLHLDEIDTRHITDLMLAIEAAGTPKKAPNILAVINRVFGYALGHRLTRNNPAQGLPLGDILKPLPKVQHRAAIVKPSELGQLIKDIDTNQSGNYCTVEALRLIPRVFLRPTEIRNLKWDYIDFEDCLIRIPAEEMKRNREHLVPMSRQVVDQLRNVKLVTGYSPLVFPNQRDSNKPMSKNILTNRLRDLGYLADVMSAHGFRSTASTILHEKGWNSEVIETQLAHLTGTATSRAYNRSLYLSERIKLMQEWADYLDILSDEH
ncbi:tyrosine-type recombinase/integrase [Vibrio sp. 10N.261.45.A4]|uniref:tyrosine-type recombinase/integrase n=1 Tax=Vibrio sp. 10N.261.45.A4 TaxID=3229655 RepID=UPI003551B6E7